MCPACSVSDYKMFYGGYSITIRDHEIAYGRVDKERWVASNALLTTKHPVIFTVNSTHSNHTL
jgi:hypothetical protein